jgi:hypothetical protein
MKILNPIKKVFNKKYVSRDKIQKDIQKAVNKALEEQKIIHSQEIDSIIDQMDNDRQVEVAQLNIEIDKLKNQNKKIQKRNEYVEDLYFKAAENSKINSIVVQEMSTDAMRLENELVGLTRLIHGINLKAQLHYKKCEKDKMKVRQKLKGLEV